MQSMSNLFFYLLIIWSHVSARESDETAYKQFLNFMNKFGKTYPSEEEYEYRFKIFKSNLQLSDLRNKEEQVLGGTAVHGTLDYQIS